MEDRAGLPGEDACGPSWTFQGYQLDAGHFTTAMVHFYRAEVNRANTWRTRLDATTNWAVITVGAALTFAFGAPRNPHYVLLLVFLLVLAFLYIEARRYRYYALWSYRVHLMETDFFAAMLAPPFRPSSDWADHLVQSLLQPSFPVANWEAIARRFIRNYVWLIVLLVTSWVGKLALHPLPASDLRSVIERAAIGRVPGASVVTSVGLVLAALAALAVLASLPRRWRLRRVAVPRLLRRLSWGGSGPSILGVGSDERLATIITSRGDLVSARLLRELGRGVTELQGTGMYTGTARDVLLCAVTTVQVPHLREIVHEVDADAFIVVSPVEEVRGRGFRPFEAPS
jgi:uncharacterized membrane protein